MVLIENLLDLSHLAFLHKAVDQQHVAVIPSEAPAPPNGVAWRKVIESTEVALAAVLCGGDPKRSARQEDSVLQCGQALTYGYQRRTPLSGDPGPIRPAVIQVVHAITPEDERRTHQLFSIAASDPFVIEDSEVRKIIQDVVFEQDVDVVSEVQRNIDQKMRPGRIEFSMAYDVFGLKMRRILQTMKEAELELLSSQGPLSP